MSLEAATRRAGDFANWVTTKSFEGLQALNTKSEKAKETLSKEGTDILVDYNNKNAVTADRVKDVVLAMMAPVQTLEVTGVAATLIFGLGWRITPWILSPISFVAMVASAYFTYEVNQVKTQLNLTMFYFERLGEEEVSKEKFIREADNLGDRILANSSLFRTLTSRPETKSFRNIGEAVENMIKSAENQEQLVKMIQNMPIIPSLFQLAGGVGKTEGKQG